ncbi:MAG TPA: prolyl oligopeptidase family serine peptidase [Candidatus Acidoferrales bacterium]|nr:prolyl oligopeptidase family serine peptidase [Candidatus Acidoferrales bacterium]
MTKFPLESLLSARRLLSPQLIDDYIYFLSDISGVISLYRMEAKGSFPEALLPSGLALQNPHLMNGDNFVVFPRLKKILVMIDHNGDENYQPSLIPLEGGIPEPILGDRYRGHQLCCMTYDRKADVVYFYHDDRKNEEKECIKVDLQSSEETSLGTSIYGNYCLGVSKDHSQAILADAYTTSDHVLYLWKKRSGKRELLFGTSIENRDPGKEYPASGIFTCSFTENGRGIIFRTTLFDDEGSLGHLALSTPSKLTKVPVKGVRHHGVGELVDIKRIEGEQHLLSYNIDGCSWIYPGNFNEGPKPSFTVHDPIVGKGLTSDGVVLGIEPWYDSAKKRSVGSYAFSFATAMKPSQLYLFKKKATSSKQYTQLTFERVIGIDKKYMSPGEDATYKTFDGLRISARLYTPSKLLGFKTPFPLVLYVHGGPQGQERPDFTWFSMPLIQYLTLNGFAVFVPNARGSSGYGLKFMRMIDRDWGGKDSLDLVEGLKVLEKDERIDSSKRGVIGRSYGGYMTLTLVSKFPDLWKAGVDMFGPYNLVSFINRIPPAWRTHFRLSIGDPEKDKDFLLERSPSTHIDNVKCPMLMIQGRNDPRVVERETADVVERLRSRGLSVEYLVFEDEGHDVIKFKNQVTCYNKITDFYKTHLAE